jgi:threonine aldolase
LRKRSGHLFSKHRLLAAQVIAMLENGLWLRLAEHANAQARSLSEMFQQMGCKLAHPVEANEVFVSLDDRKRAAAEKAEAKFYAWPEDGPDVYRFVTSWATEPHEIEALGRVLGSIPVPQ